MPYRNDIPVDTNQVRDPSDGDLVLMKTNFAILASVVSGMSAPSQGAPMSQLVVTSGDKSWGMGWTGTDATLLYSGVGVADFNGSTFSLTGVVLAGDTAPSADTHYMRRGDMTSPKNFVEALGGHIVTVADGSVFVLDERAMYGYTINELHVRTASGTVDVTVKIGATTISGLDAVTASGTQSSHNSTDAFTVVSGNQLTLELSNSTGSPSDLTFTAKLVRT